MAGFQLTDKTDFTITFSATVNANYGGIALSGSVQNVTVDVPKLLDGEFPITGIQSASVSASGNAFGGQLSGTLIMGVIGHGCGGSCGYHTASRMTTRFSMPVLKAV